MLLKVNNLITQLLPREYMHHSNAMSNGFKQNKMTTHVPFNQFRLAVGVVRVFREIENCNLKRGDSAQKFINLFQSKYQNVLVKELKIVISCNLVEINKHIQDELCKVGDQITVINYHFPDAADDRLMEEMDVDKN